MRAIIRTGNPDALPETYYAGSKTEKRRERDDETFVVLEGIAGIGEHSDGSGVRIWFNKGDDGILTGHPGAGGFFDHGTIDDDYTAELVASGDDDTSFPYEPTNDAQTDQ